MKDMSCKSKTVTCEYVSFGHPDKLADQIADAILDKLKEQDPNVRSGIEVMVKDNFVILGGEVKTSADIDYERVVKDVFKIVNYPPNHHLNPENINVINKIGLQSSEISNLVDKEDGEIGAGDQGFVVGYASSETENLMPVGHHIAKKICDYVAHCTDKGLGPDVKTQVIMEYDNESIGTVAYILVSTMHQCSLEEAREFVTDAIKNNKVGIDDNINFAYIRYDNPIIDVNPAGEWRIGGPVSDCGVTGRKIVVDQYGGYSNVGGGAFSGKDFSKVDRSAAYMARYLAKNIVDCGIWSEAKVELSYVIGIPKPCAVNVELDEWCSCGLREAVEKWIIDNIDMTPRGIMKRFGNKFSFLECATNAYWDDSFPWEKTDLSTQMRKDLREYL
jgi:S-adenosylmethionine synthetase